VAGEADAEQSEPSAQPGSSLVPGSWHGPASCSGRGRLPGSPVSPVVSLRWQRPCLSLLSAPPRQLRAFFLDALNFLAKLESCCGWMRREVRLIIW